jgi:phosphate transport system substrate-binding protein
VDVIPGIREYLKEFTSDSAWGEFGYLSDKGLVPLPEKERGAMATQVRSLATLKPNS